MHALMNTVGGGGGGVKMLGRQLYTPEPYIYIYVGS